MTICVAFVDDHPILLEGMIGLYSMKKDLSIVAHGNNAVDAVKIAEQHTPDVIVIDLSMPGDSLAAIDIIIKTVTKTKVVIFTATSSIEMAVKALNLGVSGYVLKGSTTMELHEAIIAAYNGETYMTPGFATKVIMSMKTAEIRQKALRANRLNAREEQIVQNLLRGRTNREIAQCLDISEKTVKHYMTVLMQKLDVRNRVEVVLAAQKIGSSPDLLN
ncbi:response regulator transcription factor [Rhizobium sp. PL01]|jgi:two-component system nitrate/nitrite response regulator NarL|uniref:response regulator transcription factor n=1 Tax=Rhizobium sp. PL01 TaxID=3085631 RepID=UPI002981C693|nr:response regulator transcription factor [Rhizobium sp. PL01]MDW5318248.1 response regulator transcription factor [Rhizobium sp. PL01]